METNVHHLIWPRRNYKTKTERSFRNHQDMKVRLPIEAHKELHAVIAPPLKLNAEQLFGAVALLDSLDPRLTPLERILELSEYLSDREHREQRVGANLRLQALFIEEHHGTA